tara:strand:+ start:3025 stop:4191 length:1167 start_codon:yes stop_codon:yes gene_type:complete
MKPELQIRRKGIWGFTLAEVAAVALVSSIAVVGLGTMYGRSITGLKIQDRHLDMQRQLRHAIEMIKQDVRLAGFMATPNSSADQSVCPQPANILRAVILKKADGDIFDGSSNPNISPVSLTLFGDFSGGRTFTTTNISGNSVQLINDADLPQTEAEWDDVFKTNRYLKITTNEQFDMIVPITAATFNTKRVEVEVGSMPRVSPPQMCGVEGFGTGYHVNVVNFIRYRIMRSPETNSKKEDLVLVREELDNAGEEPIENTRLIVARDVVDMQFYDFFFDDDLTGTDPELSYFPTIDSVDGGGLVPQDRLGVSPLAKPEDLRAITVKLTARTPSEDPDVSHTERSSLHAPLKTYDLDADPSGAARCISAATRIQLRSLTSKNLKPAGGGP